MITLSRRTAFLSLTAIAAGGLGLSKVLEGKGDKLRSDCVVDIYSLDSDPAEVVKYFATAESIPLTASFAIGFPKLLHKYDTRALGLIRTAATAESALRLPNQHRLSALPAAVAAQLLPRTNGPSKIPVCEAIASGLQDKRREVREIVLLNLLAVTAPDPDSRKFTAIDATILGELRRIIEESKQSSKLLSPLCLSVELVLNLRWLHTARQASSKVNVKDPMLKEFDKVLSGVRSAQDKVAHFFYAAKLIDLHLAAYGDGSSLAGDLILPPPRGEHLLGWMHTKIPEHVNYLHHSALIQARAVYDGYRTASGEYLHDAEFMSLADAKAALPKMIAISKHVSHGADKYQEWALDAPAAENGFKRFLKNDFAALLETGKPLPDAEAFTCMPFAQFNTRRISAEYRKRFEDGRMEKLLGVVKSVGDIAFTVAGGMAGGIATQKIDKGITIDLWNFWSFRRQPPPLAKADLQKLRETVEHELGQNLDQELAVQEELESRLGPIEETRDSSGKGPNTAD